MATKTRNEMADMADKIEVVTYYCWCTQRISRAPCTCPQQHSGQTSCICAQRSQGCTVPWPATYDAPSPDEQLKARAAREAL